MINIELKTLFFAITIAILLLVPYEYYWGAIKHYPKTHDVESMDLWAEWRSKVDDLDSDDIIILGSSRGHFDINIHLWDSITGTRPIMLAYPGSSPFYPVEDIVKKSEFKGLLIISIAPGLFYTLGDSWGAGRGKEFVDYYYKRTYAQKLNHAIYKQIAPLMSYIDPSLSLKYLIEMVQLPNRDSVVAPDIWPPMIAMDRYRNVRMIPQMETDTVLQKRQKEIWFNPKRKNRYADSTDTVIKHYSELALELKSRGGRVVYVRPPSTDYYWDFESVEYPRENYWEELICESESPGFHFMDHPDTKYMEPPEWSHLNRRDADIYTKTIINLLRQEKILNY